MKFLVALLLVLSLGACGSIRVGGPSGDTTVVVCHKGKKTLEIPQHAADAHLNHGDWYGSC